MDMIGGFGDSFGAPKILVTHVLDLIAPFR